MDLISSNPDITIQWYSAQSTPGRKFPSVWKELSEQYDLRYQDKLWLRISQYCVHDFDQREPSTWTLFIKNHDTVRCMHAWITLDGGQCNGGNLLSCPDGCKNWLWDDEIEYYFGNFGNFDNLKDALRQLLEVWEQLSLMQTMAGV